MDKNLKEIEERLALAKENYKGPFCCFDMDSILDQSEGEPIYKIDYYPHKREYFLESIEGYICTIYFCPWCGSKLPKNLHKEWFDILEKEYGLDLPDIPDQKKKIPAEFKTDEWWKKRRL